MFGATARILVGGVAHIITEVVAEQSILCNGSRSDNCNLLATHQWKRVLLVLEQNQSRSDWRWRSRGTARSL